MKILIIDPVHDILPKTLKNAGHDIELRYAETYQYYASIISSFDGIIIRSGIKIDEAFINLSKNLKFIARVGAGMENIDVSYAESKRIICFNSPEGNRTAVGEHALGMILSLFNNLNRSDLEVRKALWQREANRGIELEGKTIGIIGYGNMGSAFAKRLCGFDANIITFDKYKKNYSDDYVRETSMEELFQECDIVSLHTPLTDETKNLINSKWINLFQKNIYLINTARGPILNTNDLVVALKSGKVSGACLDVLEYEKLGFENIEKDDLPEAFQYLTKSDRVILSPHIAGWTHESNFKLSKVIADKILQHFN